MATPEDPKQEPKTEPKKSERPWPPVIDPEAYERARRATEEKERQERARFPDGKPFPIPDKDVDS